MARTRVGAKAGGGPAAGRGRSRSGPAARPKQTPKPKARAETAAATPAQGPARAPCACGGDCPSCRAHRSTAQSAPVTPPRRPKRTSDAAEREARTLGRRLSLIGEPAAAAPAPTPRSGTAGDRPALRETAAPHPRLTRARRLDPAERRAAEEALGLDLGAVLIHTGPVARALADREGAAAFTHGTHIVLGRAAEAAGPLTRARIVAHELIHVVQQAAPPLPAASLPAPPRHARPEARGPPLRPRIRAPPQVQCLSLDDLGGYADAVATTVVRAGSGAIDSAVEFGGDVADTTIGAVREAVDTLAPGLWDFLSGGAIDEMAGLLCQGIDLVLGPVFDGIAEIDIMSTLEMTFSSLAQGVHNAGAAASAAISNAVGAMFAPVSDALKEWGDPLIAFIQTLTSTVGGAFSGAWDSVAVPALNFLETAGGAVWEAFTGLVGWLWDLIEPVRTGAAWAWERVSSYFEIAWNSTADIRASLADYAGEAFDSFLELIEPIKTPLMVAGGLILALSPLGPVLILTQVVPPLYDKIKWLIDNWDKTEVVVEARQYLHDVILPGIIGTVDTVKSALVGAAVWLAGILGQLATGMLRVVGAFSGNRCLKTVNRIIAHIDDQVQRFRDWATGGFAGLNGALGALFDALKALFQPILDFIVRLLIVSANPFMLPVALAAAVWLFLPDPLKPPVIRFILGLLIAAVEAMPAFLPGLFPLASVMKAGVLGFLRHLRGDAVSDDQRITASNKIASLLAGAGVQFIAGFAVGILEGLIDGIIDPFRLLFMLFDLVMKGIAVVGRVVDRVVELLSPSAASWMRAEVRAAVGPPPPGPAAASAAAAEGAQAPQPTPVAEAATGGGGAIVSRRPGTTGTITARGPPAAGPAPAGAASPSSAAPAPTEADLAAPDPATDRVRREVRAIRPPAEQPRAPAGGGVGSQTGEITARRGTEAIVSRGAAGGAAPEAAATAAAGGGMRAAGEIEALPAGGAAEGEAALDSDLTDEQIVANLSPSALSGVPAADEGEITAEGLETGMRSEVSARGASVGGLARLLGDAWDAVMAGAARVGGMAAGWLMEFLALPDYQLGNKLGYLTGIILLELIIAYFTAGGYMVIKEGATVGARLLAYFLRFLDMGGAILGVMGKGLAKLRRPIMGGFDVAAGFLSKFRFLDGVMGRVRGAAEWLFRFGDELGRAADIARRGPIDDAAGRGVMGLADDAAEGAARGADEVPGLMPRAADEVPAGPARLADEVPAGPARAADEVPAGPARAADEVPATPARAADEGADAASDRAAREAMDDAGGRAPSGGLDEAADGSRRTSRDTPPTRRDEARRAAEFPVALAAARQIAEVHDTANMPVPVVLGALLALKTRFRWIDHFTARPIGPGAFRIAMVASPPTTVDSRYTVFETPERTPPPRAADPDAWRTPPAGTRPVESGPHYVIYEMPDGTKRIRFDTRQARTAQDAMPGRNMTDEARAGVSGDGRPYVWEGRHRSAGASQGDVIPEGMGGVPGHPEVLDFPFAGHGAPSSGLDVPRVRIDHDVPEMDPATLGRYTEATDMRFFDPKARGLTGVDADLASPRRGREIADDILANPGNAPPTRTAPQPDGSLRADPAGHPPRGNMDAKAGQLSAAIMAAHAIVGLNDRINTPVPAILAQLMALKAHYRWIDTFEASPIGAGRFRFFMIASRTPVGDADLLDLPGGLPRGASVHAGPDGVTVAPPGRMPEVTTLPPGARRPAGPAPEASAAPRPPREHLPEPEQPRRGYDSEDLAEDYQRTIHGGRTPEDALEQARVPSYKTRSEGVAESAGRLENNKGFGTANEAIFNRYLDEGVGEVAERFENLATQVHIEPIIGRRRNGEPMYAGYHVIADNVARDRVTGTLVILDAKTARTLQNGTIKTAPLSKNQRAGYPLIAANGGRVKSQGLAGELAHHSVIEPTPVVKAKPSIDLAKDPLPPGGRIDYSLEPVTPAGGLAGQQVIPVRPLPHPAATGPHLQAAERSGAEIGREIATTPPPGPFRRPTDVGEGSLRAADDPAFPTVRNHAEKFAQMPQALAAARAIIAAGDAVNLPAPVILGQLMLLKRRFRWIETFRADPTGPTTWSFMLIASSVRIATADLGEPLVLFHGSPGPGARQLAHAMEDTRQGFASSVRDHDLGQGLYLFEDRLGAAHYAGPGGTILRLEIPRPHPDEIADISLQGFGRGGLPGAERELLLARRELEGVLSIDEALALMNRRGGPPLDPHSPPIQMGFFGKTRENVKNFLTRATADPASPFSRNLARAQLFHGTVPPHAMLARGGLGFEYDIIQWRIRQPTEDLRRQIVAQILGR